MKMVEDWQKAYKWFSVRAMVLASAIQGAWIYIPDDMRATIPHSFVSIATIALLCLGVAGRLIQQDSKNAEDAKP